MTRAQLIAYITGILALTGTLVGLSLWTGSIDPETGYPEPITVDGKTIEFTWTDDNTNEDLIIYTDQATYTNGLSHAEVYIALHNNSGIKQNVSFGGYFRDSTKQVAELSVLLEVTEEFSETVQVEDCKNQRDYISTTSPDTGETIEWCNRFREQTNTWQETSLRWVPLPQEERNELVDAVNLSKSGRTQKSVEDFIADKVANYEMNPGEIVYLKALVKFPPNSGDNFYFEAVGSEGGYGHLDPWWDSGWNYKVKIEVNPDHVDSDLTNFPLYIDLSTMPSTFKDNILTDGADIRVLESDESTETAFEIVTASTTASYGEMYILVDTLSSSATTTLYIYYGNATATAYSATDTYGRNNVWTDYLLVAHMADLTSTTILDSSGTATWTKASAGNPTATSSTFYTEGQEFDNSTGDYIYTTTALNSTQPTYQTWFIPNTFTNYFIMMAKRNSASNGAFTFRVADSGGNGVFQPCIRHLNAWVCPTSATSLSTGQKYAFTGTTDGSNFSIYENGVGKASSTLSGSVASYSANTYIGLDFQGSNTAGGGIGETRIRNGGLSRDWIYAEYINTSAPSTFYFTGTQETDGGGGGGTADQSTVIMFE